MKDKARVVIVGGGIIGCSVAYHLAQEGISDVILLEMMPTVGRGETRWTVAMLMHQTENELLTRLARESIEEYAQYKDEGAPFDFRRVGSILYTTKTSNAPKIRDRVRTQTDLGIESYEVSPQEIRLMVPFAKIDDIVLGSYCPLDGYIHNHDTVVEWYKTQATKQGVEFCNDTRVSDLVVENGHVCGVVTSSGKTIRSEYVVNAAGRMGHLIAKFTGITIPMNGDRRNVFRLKPHSLVKPFPIVEDIDEDSKWYFRPDGENIIFGMGPTTPVVTDKFERILDRSAIDDWASDALDKFIDRRITGLEWEPRSDENSWSAVRSLIPDDLPILGPVENLPGLINCCGLSGFGITTGPISGRLIAELIANNPKTAIPLKPFSLSRFDYRSWRRDGSDLMLGSKSVRSIVKEFGTPLYLYDGEIVLNRLALVRAAFPDFEVLYSFKANPNQALAQLLANANTGAELASISEVEVALGSGYKPSQITLGGPGKRRDEMQQAVLQGVGTIDIESERELQELEAIGTDLKKSISATLRINTDFSLKATPGERMAGTASQYGIDESAILQILARTQLRYVRIEGLHVHIASQVLDQTDLHGHYVYTAELAKRLSADLGFAIKVINFGGGIGIPYSTEQTPMDLFTLGTNLRRSLSSLFPDPRLRPRFQLELGRFLVASSGVFLASVVEIKRSKGTVFVITDGGISAFSRPAMPWAQQHPCSIASKQGQVPTGRYKVVGRSCLPADVLCESVELPDPQAGDTIVIHEAGAYGYSMSMLLWASQSRPREILYNAKEFEIDNSHRLTETLSQRPFEDLAVSS